jgi:clan AA aspartic protease
MSGPATTDANATIAFHGVHLSEPGMGEIRVSVKLVNAVDEALARRGQLVPSAVRTYVADAMVDTGAVRSILPSFVVERLGLQARGQRVAEYADVRKEAVDVTEPVILEIDGRDTMEEALVLGDEVLIGQTVLEKLDLLADCAGRRLIPNPAHPDQPVSKVK